MAELAASVNERRSRPHLHTQKRKEETVRPGPSVQLRAYRGNSELVLRVTRGTHTHTELHNSTATVTARLLMLTDSDLKTRVRVELVGLQYKQ